jgi:hypothetical protein
MKGVSKVIETSRLVRVTVRGEMDGLLAHGDCFVEISNVPHMLKLTEGGVSEVVETCRLVRVIVWGETGSLLLHCNHFVEIGNVT